jgi:hypothetical protein
MYIYIYVYVCINIFIYKCIKIFIYIYIYTYIEKNMSSLYVAVNYELLSIAEFLLECGALIDIQRKGIHFVLHFYNLFVFYFYPH